MKTDLAERIERLIAEARKRTVADFSKTADGICGIALHPQLVALSETYLPSKEELQQLIEENLK